MTPHAAPSGEGSEAARLRTRFLVAIDGPAGVGKSTLARRLAIALGIAFVNTGLMYRALADRAIRLGIGPEDEPRLAEVARGIAFDLRGDSPSELAIDGRSPSADLSSPGVEAIVSRISGHPGVRSVLRARQRALAATSCVMEGRDIASVVLPDADVKILLVASPEVRAGRRRIQRGGRDAVVSRRDALDARTTPLNPGPDTHLLDTSTSSAEDVFRSVLSLIEEARR